MTWSNLPPRKKPEVLAHAGSDRLPAVRVVAVSDEAKNETALGVVEKLLSRVEGQKSKVELSDVEWAALRHMEALAARVGKNPGLRRLGYRVELSPYLRGLLEGGR